MKKLTEIIKIAENKINEASSSKHAVVLVETNDGFGLLLGEMSDPWPAKEVEVFCKMCKIDFPYLDNTFDDMDPEDLVLGCIYLFNEGELKWYDLADDTVEEYK